MKMNYTGQKFGKLTFIKLTGKKRGHALIWELLCDCGITIERAADDVRAGHTKSCGCYRKELGTIVGCKRGVESRKHHPRVSSAKEVWRRTYKDGDVSLDTFLTLSQLPCYYCGSLPTRAWNLVSSRKGRNHSQYQIDEGTFTYNGLDRLDSSIGHSLGNVVSCCWDCNLMKGKKTVREFLSHIGKISSFQLTSHILLASPSVPSLSYLADP